jgi:hypothetical protein
VMFSVVAMILCAIYIHYTECLHHNEALPLFLLHLFPSVYINGNMLAHLYKAVTMSAGSPAPGLGARGSDGRPCNVCNVLRGPGTYHCSTCNRCSLDMDHHWSGRA